MNRRPRLRLALAAVLLTIGATPARADNALLSRPADGHAEIAGLGAAARGGTLPRWPVRLGSPTRRRLACWLGRCDDWDRLELALQRAAQWMAAFPPDGLRFDAAMGLAMIRESVDGDALRQAFERARTVADRDADNPQRRFWTPGFSAPAEHTSRWAVPTSADKRVNTNRVVAEALYCKENGWRPETMRYVCGPMRDDGGYETTHALWALFLVRRNGCDDATWEPCVRALQKELADKQPHPLRPAATLDIDLFAERLQSTVLTGMPDAVVDEWARSLMAMQGPDGSWGVDRAGEEPYYRYHATMVSTWALAEWYRRLVGHPELRPDRGK